MLKGFHRTDREMAWSVADDTRITEAGLRVMFIALAMEREPGDEVCLTTSEIQQNSRLKVRAIERGRANLVEFGYLQESPNCRRGNNLYTINCTTLFNDIDDGRNDDSDVSPGKRNDDSDASNDNSDVLNDDSDALNDNSDVSLGEIHYKETETGNYTGKSESFSPSPESASYTPDAPKPEADPKGDDEPTDGQTPTSPSAQTITEAQPVDEPASPPVTPAKKTNKREKPPKPKVTFNGTAFVVPEIQLTAWKDAHPGIDVEGEIKRACAWFIADGQKKKALGKYVNNWLARQRPKKIEPVKDDYGLSEYVMTQAEYDALERRVFDSEEDLLAYREMMKQKEDGNAAI